MRGIDTLAEGLASLAESTTVGLAAVDDPMIKAGWFWSLRLMLQEYCTGSVVGIQKKSRPVELNGIYIWIYGIRTCCLVEENEL